MYPVICFADPDLDIITCCSVFLKTCPMSYNCNYSKHSIDLRPQKTQYHYFNFSHENFSICFVKKEGDREKLRNIIQDFPVLLTFSFKAYKKITERNTNPPNSLTFNIPRCPKHTSLFYQSNTP